VPTLPPLEVPVVAAPMAGGPSTPALVAAVAAAGGLGFVAGGYLEPDALDAALHDLAAVSDRPFGVNLFLPSTATSDRDAVETYAARLTPEAAARGVALGDPWPARDPDGAAAVDEKIAVLARHRPAVVSCTFALPTAAQLAALRGTGAAVAVTVTSVEEARAAADLGVDVLWVQGAEAGGHRGVHHDVGGDPSAGAVPVRDLVRGVRVVTDLPLIGSGGLMTATDVREVLDAGAVAAGLGTAFLACPEAGTSATHRAALLAGGSRDTVVTRAFTGRPARGLDNRFTAEHAAAAPADYPAVHHLTRPLRAAAAKAGDPEGLHLWAGTGWRAVGEEPAGALVGRLARGLSG
jgi:nitronate monooxygenase